MSIYNITFKISTQSGIAIGCLIDEITTIDISYTYIYRNYTFSLKTNESIVFIYVKSYWWHFFNNNQTRFESTERPHSYSGVQCNNTLQLSQNIYKCGMVIIKHIGALMFIVYSVRDINFHIIFFKLLSKELIQYESRMFRTTLLLALRALNYLYKFINNN